MTRTNLSGANLTGANLEKVDNFDTANTTNTKFCRTIMPDGSMNNSGC